MQFIVLMSVLTFFNVTGGTMLSEAEFMQPQSPVSIVEIEDVSSL